MIICFIGQRWHTDAECTQNIDIVIFYLEGT